jgi:hypothetical protein
MNQAPWKETPLSAFPLHYLFQLRDHSTLSSKFAHSPSRVTAFICSSHKPALSTTPHRCLAEGAVTTAHPVTVEADPKTAGALNRFSSRITQPASQGASQAQLYGVGLTEEDMNKAQVGASAQEFPSESGSMGRTFYWCIWPFLCSEAFCRTTDCTAKHLGLVTEA